MEITLNKAIAPPDFDLEALKRSLQQSAHFRNRVAAKRGAQREFAAATRQTRQETIAALEGELSRAGVDVPKLRETLAQNRKRLRDAAGTLPPRVTPSAPAGPAAIAATRSRFRSLQALAGRAVPLDQPSQIFLNEAVNFIQQPYTQGTTSASLGSGNVFFQTWQYVEADDPQSFELNPMWFTFQYVWNNETDMAMIVDVTTLLDLYGSMTASAQGNTLTIWPIFYFSTRCSVSGFMTLGDSWQNPVMEYSGTVVFGDVTAHTHTDSDQEYWNFNHELSEITFNGFLLPPHSPLIINVWTQFEVDFYFNDNDFESFGSFGFGGKNAEAERISCPGVSITAWPVRYWRPPPVGVLQA